MLMSIYLVAMGLFLWRVVALSRAVTTSTISSSAPKHGMNCGLMFVGFVIVSGFIASRLPEMSWTLIVEGYDYQVGEAIRFRHFYVLFSALSYAGTMATLVFLLQSGSGWREKSQIRVCLVATFLTLTWIYGTAYFSMMWSSRIAGTYLYWDPQTIARFVFFGMVFASFVFTIILSFSSHARKWQYWAEVLLLSTGLLAKLVGGILGTTLANLDQNPWL